MTAPEAFSLRIFVAAVDTDGLRRVEQRNWNGRAVMFPQPLFPEVRHREKLKQAGA